ncbi:MAG: hypothetical protein JOZ81_16675 [Chloroflexi bacterium]|nr:hypothetical protein [Chloroflexota bacterium]MBV9545856.1 hypothetical protein [Chloroflexota bacterium]
MASGPPRDSAAFEVRDALGAEGCVVCQLALRSVGRLLQSIAYEQLTDVDLRAQLRSARGFCNTHAYRWLRESRNILGTAVVYGDIIRSVLRELDSTPTGDGLLRRALRRPRAGARCAACEAQAEAEDRYLGALLESLSADDATRQAFSVSHGLCRRHTFAALRRGGEAAELVVSHARELLERLLQDLDEVVRKEDYRFRHEGRTDAERVAAARAVAWVTSSDGIVDVS